MLAPCALGGVFDDVTIPQLQCRAIVGRGEQPARRATVRPSSSPARDILFVPDFVASAGGIINIAEEFVGYDRARALEHTAGIEPTTHACVLRRARPRCHPAARRRGPRPRPHRRGGRRPPLGTRRPRRLDERRPLTRLRPCPLTAQLRRSYASRRQSAQREVLAHVAGVAEGVAAGLGPDREAVRLGADRILVTSPEVVSMA